MRILSLGAGVQSSTLLLLGCRGEEPMDAAIFADTQWEPAAVYAHLAWLETQATAAGIPVYRVTTGNLRADALNASTPQAWMPLFVRNLDDGEGMLRRQCTSNYKIAPIRRQVRVLMAEHGVRRADQLVGISLDEAHRMRDSAVRYLRNVYPLIERGWTRSACLDWLAAAGYPRPPKSSCIGCPFHGDAQWRALRDEAPAEWADAVNCDHAIRQARVGIDGEAYLHRQRVPLDEADLDGMRSRRARANGPADLFGNECFGVCGV